MLCNLKNEIMKMSIFTFITIILTGMNMAVLADDLYSLSDEFNEQSTLENWEYFHEVEKWPNRIDKIEVDKGSLLIEPQVSAWVADLQGVFIFKKIKGDFIITTRVYVNGKHTEKSNNDWALAGLMARTPKQETQENWKPNTENWVYLMHGKSPYPFRSSITDSKSNTNSKWEADLSGSQNGVELRMVRIGSLIINLRRLPNKEWVVLDRYLRPDMPETLQVGINTATCNELYRVSDFDFNARTRFFKDEVPDLVAKFDYVRYRRPNITTEITKKTSDKALLAILEKE